MTKNKYMKLQSSRINLYQRLWIQGLLNSMSNKTVTISEKTLCDCFEKQFSGRTTNGDRNNHTRYAESRKLILSKCATCRMGAIRLSWLEFPLIKAIKSQTMRTYKAFFTNRTIASIIWMHTDLPIYIDCVFAEESELHNWQTVPIYFMLTRCLGSCF